MTAPERVHAHVQVLLIKYKQRLTLHRQTLKYIYYGKTLNSLQFCLGLGENKGWEMAHRLRRAQPCSRRARRRRRRAGAAVHVNPCRQSDHGMCLSRGKGIC
jgi:hypothetical protein